MNALLDRHPDPADTSLLKFMASAARPLKRDVNVTPLGAVDIMQKIQRKYARHWWALWIVTAKGTQVLSTVALNDAIHRIEEGGGAVGIVGIAVIARTFTFLKKPLKVGKEVSKILDKSGDAAADRFLEITEAFVKASKEGKPA